MMSMQDWASKKARDAKPSNSEIKIDKMATKSSESLCERTASPDPNCSICLSKMKDKSFTDRCFHMFCFECLVEWSKINAVCPLCKQPFKQIFHNIKSMSEYDVYDVISHPSASSLDSVLPSNYDNLHTNYHDVRAFLVQRSNERNLSAWLRAHVRDYMRADSFQVEFVSNIIIELLKSCHTSSPQFYEGVSQFFRDRTLDFIHSLNSNLHSVMNSRHTVDRFLNRVHHFSSTYDEVMENGNRIVNLPAVMGSHRTLRNSMAFIDGVLQANPQSVTNPGPSRFSLLLSIFRPPARSRNANAGSSSSSSQPGDEELIDIEQLDDNSLTPLDCKSPICVSSGEEDHVQLVECCSSRTTARHSRKRKQQTFLLVSSDEEASNDSEIVKKRRKLRDSNSEKVPAIKVDQMGVKAASTEMKVTFKKHPTGHKNSLKKFKSNIIENQNEKQAEEEKLGRSELKVEGESASANTVMPGSSSSLETSMEVSGIEEPMTDTIGSNRKQSKILSEDDQMLPEVDASSQLNKSCVAPEGSLLKTEEETDGAVESDADLIDVDTISVYSDDSIQWIDDAVAPVDYSLPGKGGARAREVVEVVDLNSSDIVVLSSEVPGGRKMRKSRRKCDRTEKMVCHFYVDLSDENDDNDGDDEDSNPRMLDQPTVIADSQRDYKVEPKVPGQPNYLGSLFRELGADHSSGQGCSGSLFDKNIPSVDVLMHATGGQSIENDWCIAEEKLASPSQTPPREDVFCMPPWEGPVGCPPEDDPSSRVPLDI